MQKKIALFIPSMAAGGAERVALNLAKGFVEKGHAVDLILVNATGPLMEYIPAGVFLVDLGKKRTVSATYALSICLRKTPYDALISFLNYANIVSVWAAIISGFKGNLILTEHSSISHSIISHGNCKKKIVLFLMRFFYKYADRVIAVSSKLQGELKDLVDLKNTSFIYNPVGIYEEGNIDTFDERLISTHKLKGGFVICAIGSLKPAKNFELLLESFKHISSKLPVILYILGEGPERNNLTTLIENLDLSDKVILKGFVPNPHDYLKKADLFVLSSSWEGFALVVAEALALGVTVVSTDCTAGPSEILENGKWGYLVPVNDQKKMSEMIVYALNNKLNPESLKERAKVFSIEKVTDLYLKEIF